MNPGELNTRIIIKQLIKSADGFGGFTNTVTTYGTIWGDVKQRSTKTQVEVICRARTIDDVNANATEDWIFQIEGNNETYRVNDLFQSELKYYTKIIGTKID